MAIESLAAPAGDQAGPGAGVTDVDAAAAFLELLALLAGSESEAAGQSAPQRPGRARAADADPEADGETGGGETAAAAAAFAAPPATLWWQAAQETPPGAEDAAGAAAETAGGGPRALAAAPGAGPVQPVAEPDASGRPAVTALAGGQPPPGPAAPETAAPVAPPASMPAPAGADAGRESAAPVSLALRLEPRNAPENPSRGTAAPGEPHRAVLPGQPVPGSAGAESGAPRPASESPLEVKPPAEVREPGLRARAERSNHTEDAAQPAAQASPRETDAQDSAGPARAEGRLAGQALTPAAPPAAAAAAGAQPQPAPEGQPAAHRSGQPAAAQRIEATPPPEAPREIWLRIGPGGAGERARAAVAVQVAERAGRIEVRVRTPDPGLGESLRREVPALVERLEREGFRTAPLEAPAQTLSPSGGALRIAPPEAAPAFEDERWRGAEGQAGRQGGQHEQGREPQKDGQGESAPFDREVTRWLLR